MTDSSLDQETEMIDNTTGICIRIDVRKIKSCDPSATF